MLIIILNMIINLMWLDTSIIRILVCEKKKLLTQGTCRQAATVMPLSRLLRLCLHKRISPITPCGNLALPIIVYNRSEMCSYKENHKRRARVLATRR